MCGISAVLTFERRGVATADLIRMHDLQRHRGPDGEGCLLVDRSCEPRRVARVASAPDVAPDDWRLGLAVRRLRVQDPDPCADQPLGSRDGKLWIAINGEIYNFRELRAELESHGLAFRTRSDTETALAAYERWGVSAFERFHGMWALLIVDLRRRRLIGCRDRLGIKPLFYAVDGGRWLIASEPQAVVAVQRDGPRIDPVRFPEFLRGFPPQSADRSYFQGVRPVPAGCFFETGLENDTGPPRFRAFWSLPRSPRRDPPPFEQAAEHFRDLLRTSVEREAVADVKVGTMLSGGLDSSMLTCLLAASRPGLPAFSINYEDRQIDESAYSREVLRACGAEGHRVLVTPALLWSRADTVIRAQGQPLLGWELIAHHAVHGLAREQGVTVVLEGHGPDEVLGGYAFHESAALREPLTKLRLVAFLQGLRASARHRGTSTASVLRVHVLAPLKQGLVRRLAPARSGWLAADGQADVDVSSLPADDELAHASSFDKLLYRDVLHANLPAVLLLQDRSAMAHGVESRVPYLDHRIVEFCFSLPASYKYEAGVRKRLLHAAARGHVPPVVLERREKRGLMADYRWFPLRSYAGPLREMASARRLRELPWIRAERLAPFVDSYLAGRHDDLLSVWRLYTAWRWLEAFAPGAPRA